MVRPFCFSFDWEYRQAAAAALAANMSTSNIPNLTSASSSKILTAMSPRLATGSSSADAYDDYAGAVRFPPFFVFFLRPCALHAFDFLFYCLSSCAGR